MCITETWTNSNHTPALLNIPGYCLTLHHRSTTNDRDRLKKGAGIAYYVKNNVNFLVKPLDDLNIGNVDIENCWINIQLKHSKPITLGITYRPPAGSIDNCMNTLHETLTRIPQANDLIMVGDFNVDFTKHANT